MNKKIFIILCCFELVACSTGYQSKGIKGGYRDIKLSDDVYKINYSGNAFTNSQKVQELALLRASDVTLSNGYRYFVVIDRNVNINKQTIKTQEKPYTFSSNCYGSSCSGTVDGGGSDAFVFSKTNSELIIKCFKEKPLNLTSFDAQIIFNSLAPIYKK